MTTVAVTGGAGFIGANLVRALMNEPSILGVRVIDDFSTGRLGNLEDIDVDVRSLSLLDFDGLATSLSGCDLVVHLAAVPSVPRSIAEPTTSFDVNVVGTVNLLEAMRSLGISRIMAASSSSVYGHVEAIKKHESLPVQPMSPYAASKAAMESCILGWSQSFDLQALVFRFFNVFGPMQRPDHDYAAVIPLFLEAARTRSPVVVHGDGLQTRDFTYVSTITNVLVRSCIESVTSPRAVNLALGTPRTLLDVLSEVESVTGYKSEVKFESPRPGDVRHSQADPTALLELFPDLKEVPLTDGLTETYEWLCEVMP